MNLFSKIDLFAKFAGLFKVPERLLNDVYDYVLRQYCMKLLPNLKERKYDNEPKLNEVVQYCLETSYNARSDSNIFDISFQELGTKHKNVNPTDFVSFDVHLALSPVKNQLGAWRHDFKIQDDRLFIGTLFIFRDIEQDSNKINKMSELNSILETIKQTVHHELQHVLQSHIKALSPLGDRGGMPSEKIRDIHYDIYGRLDSKPIDNQLQLRTPHELQDIEFYPRLSDSIEAYNSLKKNFPKFLHGIYAEVFCGKISFNDFKRKSVPLIMKANEQHKEHMDEILEDSYKAITKIYEKYPVPDNFFIMLKEHQPKKYAKAWSEFMKNI